MTDIVLVDFAGTLVRADMIEKANAFRAAILERAAPSGREHAKSEELYAQNRAKLAGMTGLSEDMLVSYRTITKEDLQVRGRDVLNAISTTLFQVGMYQVAKEHGSDIFAPGIIEQLRRMKNAEYSLAIVSGVRTDIISGMLALAGCPVQFDHIYAQSPALGISNEENIAELQKHGRIRYVLGDKLSDILAGKNAGAEAIWVTWGHPEGGESEIADYVINEASELSGIIR